MILYLARHGQASRPQPNLSPVLTENGREEVLASARWLAAQKPGSLLVWHSPAARALQTAQIFTKVLQIPDSKIEEMEFLSPEGDLQTLYREISKTKEPSLLIVSHLPLLDKFVALLLGEPHPPEASAFPTAGLSIFELEDRWKWRGSFPPANEGV